MKNLFSDMTAKDKIIVIVLVAPRIVFMICAIIPLMSSCFGDMGWSLTEGSIHLICAEIVGVAFIVKSLTLMQRILKKHDMKLSNFFYGNYEVNEEDIEDDVFDIPEELRSDRGYTAIKFQSSIFKLLSIACLVLYCACIAITVIKEVSEIKIFTNLRLIPISQFLILIGTAFSVAETFFYRLILKSEGKYYKNV